MLRKWPNLRTLKCVKCGKEFTQAHPLHGTCEMCRANARARAERSLKEWNDDGMTKKK